MNRNAATLLRDSTPVEGGLKCSRCKRVKPADCFTPRHRWCRTCNRLDRSLSRDTPEGRAKIREYNNRQEVREYKREWQKANYNSRAAAESLREYRKTDRGRLVHSRSQARTRLRKATTDEQRARLQALIDKHTAALAALDAEEED